MRPSLHAASIAALAVLAAVPASAAAQEARGLANLQTEVRALAEEVKQLSAQKATEAEALSQLAERVSQLAEELATLRREKEAMPDAVRKADRLGLELGNVNRELAELRLRISEVERPGIDAPGTVAGDGSEQGFRLTSGDGRYSLLLGGFVAPRFDIAVPGSFDDVDRARFRLRYARLSADGHVRVPTLRYRLQIELTDDGAPLRDGYLEYEFDPALIVRAGQFTIPHLLPALDTPLDWAFPEATLPENAITYVRDIGVALHGRMVDRRIGYFAAVTNGGGQNELNDNVDFMEVVRLDLAVLGALPALPFGDYEGSAEPRLALGGSAIHDLVAVPNSIAGVTLPNRDVNDNGERDNVRVVTVSADALFRIAGLELWAEGFMRHERWGSVLAHSANAEIAQRIGANDRGRRTYYGASGHALYFLCPKKLLIGGRFTWGELPLLGVNGREVLAAPLVDEDLINADALVQLYDDRGVRQIGFMYRFSYLPGAPPNQEDMGHVALVEALLRL